jgi:succinyl-CoA synthetase beta subunit
MKIHEYQAKEILRKYGVPVPRRRDGHHARRGRHAAKALFSAGNAVVVIKAQIHAGGRGKGGGVKLAKTLEDADAARRPSSACSWSRTRPAPQGQKVQRLLIEAGSAIDRELYLGLVLDRASARSSSWPRSPAAWRSKRSRTPRPS